MATLALDVLPIFLLIAVGWVAAKTGYLTASVGEALGGFVFRLAVPLLLFRTLALADFHGSSPWLLWLAYFTGAAVTWATAHMAATFLFGLDARGGIVAGVSAAFANNVFIGLPLVGRLVGEEGLVALSILLSIHLPVMMIASSLMMQWAEAGGTSRKDIGQALARVGKQLVVNPLVIGVLAGSAVHASGLGLPPLLLSVVDQIALIAGPTALISMGMALVKYGISDHIGPAVLIVPLKLFLLPAAVYAVALFTGLDPVWTSALVLTASVPTGVNAYLIANGFGVGHGLAASAITLTTALGVVTVSFWALFLMP